ncbi:MAG: protein TolQ [Gammaproteobacteria bacterium]
MVTNTSLLDYFVNAGPVVKSVMMLLVLASIVSWTLIFQRSLLLSKTKKMMAEFEEKFWSGIELNKLYAELNSHMDELTGMANIFAAGFKEFIRLRKQSSSPQAIIEGSQRAMRIAFAREVDALEQSLPLLATIGSTSPYVGLFGTVWGIMTSFQALGSSAQAGIAAVAPGISEALIATAMGLFAAIPAVISYNRFNAQVERLQNQYDTFQEEFSTILHRQAYAG